MSTTPLPRSFDRQYGLDWLRFWAILAVLGIHTSDVVLRKYGYFPVLTAEGIAYFSMAALMRFCVPVFFMMSAYLAERRFLRTAEGPERRWKRFAFPLIAATVFYVGLRFGELHLRHAPLDLRAYALLVLTGRAYYHTWYLFNALIFACLHRAVRPLASPRLFPLTLAVFTAALAINRGHFEAFMPDTPLTSVLQDLILGLGYYLVGIRAAFSKTGEPGASETGPRPGGAALPALLTLAGVVATCMYALTLRERSFFTPGTEMLAIGLFLLALRPAAPPPPAVARIGALSLGIYLWHPVILLVCRVGEGRLYRQSISPAVTLAVMLFEIVAALVGSLLICFVLLRFPRLRGLAQ